MSMAVPALSDIGQSLAAPDEVYKVVSVLVLGMVFGEILFGPLADARGRKAAILTGILIFVTGSIISLSATTMDMMLFGRFLQGFGVAGPKIGSRAVLYRYTDSS